MFDAAAFLDQTITDASSTSSLPCPKGSYTAIIEKVEPRAWANAEKGTSGVSLNVTWNIDDTTAKELTGRDKVVVFQSIFLDLNDTGGLDLRKGKNVQIGKLREAVNLNTPGQPFNFNMLVGRPAKVQVAHRIDRSGDIQADVHTVGRI